MMSFSTHFKLLLLTWLLCCLNNSAAEEVHNQEDDVDEHGHGYYYDDKSNEYKTDYLNVKHPSAGANGVYVYHSGSDDNNHEESNDPSAYASHYVANDEPHLYNGMQFYLNEVPFNVNQDAGNVLHWPNNKSNSSISSTSFQLSDLRRYEIFLPKFKKIFIYIIFAVILFTCVFGNILVIISVFTYKPLKSVQNIFIVSLAVADTMVAVFVMPFHISYQITDGRWVFGTLTCHFFLTLDILLCTSSILHLCCIALDRYWAIKDSIKYAQKRTMKRVLTMILIAWLSSALISLPVIIWNTKTVGSVTSTPPASTTVVPNMIDNDDHMTTSTASFASSTSSTSSSSSSSTEHPIVIDVVCDIPLDKLYRFYSSSGTFWVPLVIMSFVYVRIYLETKRRLRERARTAKKLANSMAKSSIIPNTIINDLPSSSAFTLKSHLSGPNGSVSTNQKKSFCPCGSSNKNSNKKTSSSTIRNLVVYQESPPEDSDGDREAKMSQILELTTTDGYTCYSPEEETQANSFYSSSATKAVISADQPSHISMRSNETDNFLSRDENDESEKKSDECVSHSSPTRHGSSIKKVSIGINTMSRKIPKIRINDESHTALAPNRPSNLSKMSRTSGGELAVNTFSQVSSPLEPNGSKKSTAATIAWRDNNQTGLALKQRQKISLTRERKAARTLGIIMGAFIACWMPFFSVYLLQAFNYLVDWPNLFEFLTWLSYVNSALNPVIYTVFNNDYRKSFERILFKCVLCKRRYN